ncbi:hypothetical protein GCM10012319_32120 [Comamonas sp. KCTC 72670]|nr:hypothetical protein GCM10012319_32120 [Comamonas sp. KCTC 72670]
MMLCVVAVAGCASAPPSRFTALQHRRAQESMDCQDRAAVQVSASKYDDWSPGETTCLQRLVAADCASKAWAPDGDFDSAEAAAQYQSHVVEACGADLTKRVRAAFESEL